MCNYNSQIPGLDFEAYSNGYFKAGFSNRPNIRRVKEVEGIMFDCYFDISRFIEKPNDIRQLRIEDQIKKSEQIPYMGLEKEVTDFEDIFLKS